MSKDNPLLIKKRAEHKGEGFGAGTRWCGGGFGDNKLNASNLEQVGLIKESERIYTQMLKQIISALCNI